MVLCFHAGFGWMPGGYLGVSVFFTLSGFLITGLLLDEHARTQRIDVGRFLARRMARLLPASLLCTTLILAAHAMGAFGAVPGIERDAVGALLQVFNWVQLAGGTSYADLFAGGTAGVTSPFEHVWSLAIEEQFYWAWPAALLVLLRWQRRRGRHVTPALLALTLAAAAAAPLIAAGWGPDAAYWSTPARLAELLVGASLAAWVRRRPGVPRGVRRAGPWALLALVAAAVVLPSGSGPAYRGALPLLALVSATVVWSLQSFGVLRRTLGLRPLAAFGRISYGVYLFHWPVDVLMRERGWDLASPGGFVVSTATTLAVSALSYRLVEQPLRTRTDRPRRTMGVAAACTAAAVVLAIVVLPGEQGVIREDVELLERAAIETVDEVEPLAPAATVPDAPAATTATPGTSSGTDATTDATPAASSDAVVTDTQPQGTQPQGTQPQGTQSQDTQPQVAERRNAAAVDPDASASTVATRRPGATVPTVAVPPAPNRPVRVLVAGDSTALYLAEAMAAWSLEHPAHAQVGVQWCAGCAFLLDGTITSFDGTAFVEQSRGLVEVDLPLAVEQLQPDIVVLMTTVNDVATRQWSDEEGPLAPTDPRFRERMAAAYAAVTQDLLDLGVPHVAWVIPPTPTTVWVDDVSMRDPARWKVHHDVMREVAAQQPGRASTIDLDAWLVASGYATEWTSRPDGVHLTDHAAQVATDAFAAPMILRRALGVPDPPADGSAPDGDAPDASAPDAPAPDGSARVVVEPAAGLATEETRLDHP